MTLTAIETQYKGYRFRSRLEARWAVFFDAMRIRWDYEPEGLALKAGNYLPDFQLAVRGGLYVEVKPGHYTPSDYDLRRWAEVAESRGILVVRGTPREPFSDTDRALYFPVEGGFEAVEVSACRKCGALGLAGDDFAALMCAPECTSERHPIGHENLTDAIALARGARFEHGEDGVAQAIKEKEQSRELRQNTRERAAKSRAEYRAAHPEIAALDDKLADVDRRLVEARSDDAKDALLNEKQALMSERRKLGGRFWKPLKS